MVVGLYKKAEVCHVNEHDATPKVYCAVNRERINWLMVEKANL